jgi:cellulose synthase (UDP-forming)
MNRQLLTRLMVVLTLGFGTVYVGWRWLFSVNWHNWWIAVPLVLAETYALVDAYLFGLTVWRLRRRGEPDPPPPGATVDVLITTYNEPVDMVMATARAAQKITHPHQTWVLDDGARPEMQQAATLAGVGYITRSDDWINRPRHAKAGNLNNALFVTEGEFLLILDADQVPDPQILDRTLGYFQDPKVALVQTPQWFSNVTDCDPLGSQAPLFYGPIQQGKDGWNAAFFCGSNAIIRREALMQLGIVGYVKEVETGVRQAMRAAQRILRRTARTAGRYGTPTVRAVESVSAALGVAHKRLSEGDDISSLTWDFHRAVDVASRSVVQEDLAAIEADLKALADLPVEMDSELGGVIVDDVALDELSRREFSPLGALESVKALVGAVDVDRGHEAQPLLPLATISVTEDMATCMRLHAAGWSSVYHHETLARGLAPEDLGTMLTQRLRWAQGTIQVMVRENPLVQRGLSLGQRLMYFATMWSYLSGFAAVVFMLAPVVYLVWGVLPVQAFGMEFLQRFLPYMIANQLLFAVVGYGVKTWRGQQYSFALFPVWIRACWTATANVLWGRPLGFAVTPKTRQGGDSFPWRLVLPQLIATVVLVVACVIGVVRLWTGAASSVVGTGVNVAWVAYDLLVMSVIFQAALYRPAPQPSTPHPQED